MMSSAVRPSPAARRAAAQKALIAGWVVFALAYGFALSLVALG